LARNQLLGTEANVFFCYTLLALRYYAYNTVHGLKWVTDAGWRATPSLLIAQYYVSTFTATKPDPTPLCTTLFSLSVIAVHHAQNNFVRSKLLLQNMVSIVRLFTVFC